MTDPYLIAHKVRGEPAFDVAIRMTCPLCDHGTMYAETIEGAWDEWQCHECDGLGYWWIIPTSGHRAYPQHYWPWDELACDSRRSEHEFDPIPIIAPPMPPDLPDHYPHSTTPTQSLTERLGIGKAPVKPIDRRI